MTRTGPVFKTSSHFLLRLQAIATPLVPNMEKVQIIPPPKDVDPRILSWKGAAVLAKMDAAADLWVTAADWVRIKGFLHPKAHSFFFSLAQSHGIHVSDTCCTSRFFQNTIGMRALNERCFYLQY